MQKHILPLALCASALPGFAQTLDVGKTPVVTPIPADKFDWKLRLTKGQKWTQTVVVRSTQITESSGVSHDKSSTNKFESLRTIVEQSEVLDVTPLYYLLRVTCSRYDTAIKLSANGAPSRTVPSSPSTLVGASFTLKQAPNGRVLDVMGLEAVLARGQKMRDGLPKTTKPPSYADRFAGAKPSLALFKQSVISSHRLFLPSTALTVGEGYSYAIALQELPIAHQSAHFKSTLVALDSQNAVFSDKSVWSVPTTQTLGAREKKTTLSTQKKPPTFEPKAFYSLKGSSTGKSTVSVASGLTVRSDVTNKSEGRYTLLDGDGHRQITTFAATTETTSSIR